VPVSYVVFDLLYLDGGLLVDDPYVARRDRLGDLDLGGRNWHTPPLAVGLAFGVAIGLTIGLLAGVLEGRLATGFARTIAFGLALGLAARSAAVLAANLVDRLRFGFALGLGFGLVFALADSATWRTVLTFTQLRSQSRWPDPCTRSATPGSRSGWRKAFGAEDAGRGR
jgi:hypothetical protein